MGAGRSKRKADRRAAIVATAAELFTDRGYEGTSVNDVADALPMSVGGLYRYIETKSDLLTLVCDDIYGRLPGTLREMAAGADAPEQRLAAVVTAYLRACAENRSLILLMYREYRHLPAAAQERYQDREEEIVAVLSELVTLTPGADSGAPRAEPDVIARDIVFLGHLPALKGWALRRRELSPPALLREQLRLISSAVGVPLAAGGDLAGADPLVDGALRWSGVALAGGDDADV